MPYKNTQNWALKKDTLPELCFVLELDDMATPESDSLASKKSSVPSITP
jgi:hypothetical protein